MLFLALWALFLDWHVDDAGISYAYARNLANGLGLRASVSAPAVEGFSNPAWTLLLTLANRLGIPLLVASKVLQGVFGALTVRLTGDLGRVGGATPLEATGAATFTAIAAPFVIWTASGLENALLACALVAFPFLAVISAPPVVVGLIAGLVTLCRPEGVVLAAAGLAACEALVPMRRWREERGPVALTALAVWLLWASARLLIFGTWLPNTFWAKIDTSLWSRLVSGGSYSLLSLGEYGGLALLAVALVTWSRIPRLSGLAGAGLSIVLIGGAGIEYMGGDWMPLGRLFSHLVPWIALASLPALVHTARCPERIAPTSNPNTVRAWASIALGLLAAIQLTLVGFMRLQPPLPMALVTEAHALMEDIGPIACDEPQLTIASADVGGMLFGNPNTEVLDLAGLTDAEVARHVDKSVYWPARIGEERPQIVLVHGVWVRRTGLTEEALTSIGYRRLCQRHGVEGPEEREYPLAVYLRDDCAVDPPSDAITALEAWCARPR